MLMNSVPDFLNKATQNSLEAVGPFLQLQNPRIFPKRSDICTVKLFNS